MVAQQEQDPVVAEEAPLRRGGGLPGSGRGRGVWWVVAVFVLGVVVFGIVRGGVFMPGLFEAAGGVKDRLTQEEAVAFVQRHKMSIIASAKKTMHVYEEHGYLSIDSVEIIPESVVESGLHVSPMMRSKGLIFYSYYINGNRDYEVIKDSIIGPYYKGTIPEDVANPWVPGRIYGDGATYSARFNEILDTWREEIDRPRLEADRREREKQVRFIERYKGKILEFARQRYGGDPEVPAVQSVVIDPITNLNRTNFPEGTYIFRFLINGDERFEVINFGIVAPEYPGFFRKRHDDGRLLWVVRKGHDGKTLKEGDLLDFYLEEKWRRDSPADLKGNG